MLKKNTRQHTQHNSKRLLCWVILIMFFIMLFIMGILKIYSPDLGFHLKSAEWMLNNKQFIYTDTFTYTSVGNTYIDLQWIYQLIIYTLYKKGGEALLIITNTALISISFLLLFVRSFKNQINDRQKTIIIFSVLAIAAVQPLSFEIRPHVFSWIFLNLILLVLERYKRGNKDSLFLLPVITLVWANTHSLAVLSIVCMAIYLAGSYFEKRLPDKKLLLYTCFSVLAFLCTPYFINGIIYPFKQFISIAGDNLQKSYITEMQSPFSSKEISMLGINYFFNPLILLHGYVIVGILAGINLLKKKDYVSFLLMAAFFVILCLAHKNYGFFVMVSLPIVVKYLLTVKNKNKEKEKDNKYKLLPVFENLSTRFLAVGYVAILISLLISITSITDGYAIFRNSPHRFGFNLDIDQLPVEAVAYLQKNKINGKILNHLDFGGYLMANCNNKVFIDGRMEVQDKDFFKKYFESITTQNGILSLIKEYNPEVVIFPYVKANIWWGYFLTHKKSSGYKAVYFDGLAVIYVKDSSYPYLNELTEDVRLAAVLKYRGSELDSLIKSESKPIAKMAIIKGLTSKQIISISDQNRATFCFTFGFENAALAYSANGINKSTVNTPAIFKNLALYFTEKGLYDKAELCDEKTEDYTGQ